jgi:hypothetical protein
MKGVSQTPMSLVLTNDLFDISATNTFPEGQTEEFHTEENYVMSGKYFHAVQ